jgi:hypothetical protein
MTATESASIEVRLAEARHSLNEQPSIVETQQLQINGVVSNLLQVVAALERFPGSPQSLAHATPRPQWMRCFHVPKSGSPCPPSPSALMDRVCLRRMDEKSSAQPGPMKIKGEL